MRYNRTRLAVAISLLLAAQSVQAGPMWTGRAKRNPGVFLDIRMENSQAPTVAHDGYGYEPDLETKQEEPFLTMYARSDNGDQTTPRPIFETLNSTPEPNPLLSETRADETKKSPYSGLPEPVEVIPVQPSNETPQPTSEAQEPTQKEPVNKPTFTQNTSAAVVTTSIVPKDPATEVEKPTTVTNQPQYQPPVDSTVVTETVPATKEIPTQANEAPTSDPVNEVTTAVPEIPTTEAVQKPENTETKVLDSTVDLGTLQPSEGDNTKTSAVKESPAPVAPSSPATASGDEQPKSTPVEDMTTTFAYQPTPTGYLTTQAPGDTAFPINPKHPSSIYPTPPSTPVGNVPETSVRETEPASTIDTVSVIQPKEPQLETTSEVQPQPAPTSEAAQPESQIPVSEPAQPNNPAPTSEFKQTYAPVETPGGQKTDAPSEAVPIETTTAAEPQNPAPILEPAQPATSAIQQPEAPADTSVVQQPTPSPSNFEPQYPAPDSNTQPTAPAGPSTTTVVASNPSTPETSSAAKVVPTGSPANGVPTINTEVPTGTSAIPAPAYASNVIDARKYNDDFAKLTPESPCVKGQAACISGQTALCGDDGTFKLIPCGTEGEKCFALPLYNVEGGIKIVCEDPATAGKILGGTPSSGDEKNTAPGSGNQDNQPVPTSAVQKQPEVPVVTVTTIVTVDDGAAPEPTREPVGEQPSQPAQEKPTQPVNEQPSQPTYQQPTQPQPMPEKTTQPVPEQPSQPFAEQPAQPTSPESSQPAQTQPVQEQPSEPNEQKPPQTNPQEPSNPQPTKAYEDLPPTSPPVAAPSTTSVNLPGGTTLTKSIKKPDEAKPTTSPGSDNDNDGKDNDGDENGDDGNDDDDKPTSVVLIPIPDKPTKAPAPAATEANADSQDDKKPMAGTRTGDDAHATTIVVDGTPTVSVYFTVTVTDKDQATVTVTEKERETVTLVISA